jgi:multicomponent Na+:H+ antiporter subunit A
VWGAFWTRPGVEPTPLHAESPLIGLAPGILSAASLVAAFAIPAIEPLLAAYADELPGPHG